MRPVKHEILRASRDGDLTRCGLTDAGPEDGRPCESCARGRRKALRDLRAFARRRGLPCP